MEWRWKGTDLELWTGDGRLVGGVRHVRLTASWAWQCWAYVRGRQRVVGWVADWEVGKELVEGALRAGR